MLLFFQGPSTCNIFPILHLNNRSYYHSITCSGAFTNSNAHSTITVTHKQQGHMHVNNSLRKLRIKDKVLTFLIFSLNQTKTHVSELEITTSPTNKIEIKLITRCFTKLFTDFCMSEFC